MNSKESELTVTITKPLITTHTGDSVGVKNNKQKKQFAAKALGSRFS